MTRLATLLSKSVFIAAVALVWVGAAIAQSGDVSFPTPLTSNEIEGKIKARDIGDNRQTTYYFAFDGEQGDIFVNVVTKDLDGDIDIFAVSGMRPLTKMVVYSDSGQSETGRLIYLRKPERLLLRIQGRPPGDTAATFRVKFAGSFVALKGGEDSVAAPVVSSSIRGESRVNSVGTLIRTETPPVKAAAKEEIKTPEETPAEAVVEKPVKPPAKRPPTKRVVVTTDLPTSEGSETVVAKKRPPAKRQPVAKRPPVKKAEPPKESADPLENVRLVIEFKDGTRNDLRMPEILRFSVARGELVVIRKNGTIERYSMIDVAKVTIE